MAADASVVLTLRVEPCPEDPSRYRWVICDQDCILRQCIYSLPDEPTALRQGEAALREVTAMWRDAN